MGKIVELDCEFDDALVCPKCGGCYTHQEKVEVGHSYIRIHFSCENCDSVSRCKKCAKNQEEDCGDCPFEDDQAPFSVLEITQHEGCTYFEWCDA